MVVFKSCCYLIVSYDKVILHITATKLQFFFENVQIFKEKYTIFRFLSIKREVERGRVD